MVRAFDDHKLEIRFHDNVYIRLVIRGRITQIYGESATGKSLLGYVIKATENYNMNNHDIDYDVSNIMCIDSKDKIDAIKGMTGGLIIIDRADAFLSQEDVSYIRNDKNNTYLIMSRCNLDLGISPNYYAELVNNDGVIELKYEYSVEG
ncbi:MAG: hypothetical protein K6E91_03175 [Butyrivibrio sp.]|nr:hypothetical protein [Butyrivibrio sp.]